MSKPISIENYARKRGFQKHTRRISKTTPAGKLASEYFALLSINTPDVAILEFLKKWSTLKKIYEKKS